MTENVQVEVFAVISFPYLVESVEDHEEFLVSGNTYAFLKVSIIRVSEFFHAGENALCFCLRDDVRKSGFLEVGKAERVDHDLSADEFGVFKVVSLCKTCNVNDSRCFGGVDEYLILRGSV